MHVNISPLLNNSYFFWWEVLEIIMEKSFSLWSSRCAKDWVERRNSWSCFSSMLWVYFWATRVFLFGRYLLRTHLKTLSLESFIGLRELDSNLWRIHFFSVLFLYVITWKYCFFFVHWWFSSGEIVWALFERVENFRFILLQYLTVFNHLKATNLSRNFGCGIWAVYM